MRVDCKHYETRSYASGETVRKCNLDLAPDAPWRCPASCPSFAPRLADVNWAHGSLIVPATPVEPPGLDDGTAAAVLDEAEDIVNSALRSALAEVDGAARTERSTDPWWRRYGFGRRR